MINLEVVGLLRANRNCMIFNVHANEFLDRYSQVFFVTRPPKGGYCNPLDFLYVTLNTLYLLPVYRYGSPLCIDTKMSTIELHMTSL